MERTSERPEKPDMPLEATEAGSIDLGSLADYIGFHLRLAQNASFKAFKRHTGESELRPGWYAILSLIASNPGITPLVLSRSSGRDKSTLTPILRELLNRKLIERRPVAGDRRSYSLALTSAGRGKLDHLDRCAARHDEALDRFVGDRKHELIAMLRRIAAEIE